MQCLLPVLQDSLSAVSGLFRFWTLRPRGIRTVEGRRAATQVLGRVVTSKLLCLAVVCVDGAARQMPQFEDSGVGGAS
jgi:hypothetical protein